jgi:hypothetical protein
MTANAKLEVAVTEMAPEEFGGSHDGERLAAAYVLLGRHSNALEVLAQQEARMASGRYPGIGSFRRFAENVRSHIETSLV